MAITVNPQVVQLFQRATKRFAPGQTQPVNIPSVLPGQVVTKPPPRVRNSTGVDDAIGKGLQVTGATVALVPDPVVFGATLALTKSPVYAAKAAVSINLVGLGLIGLGGVVRYID